MSYKYDYQIGQVVFSKAGRDKGRAFIIVSVEDEGRYLLLCDGELRPLEKPKRKKGMHIQKTNTVLEEIKRLLASGQAKNADLRKALRVYEVRRFEDLV